MMAIVINVNSGDYTHLAVSVLQAFNFLAYFYLFFFFQNMQFITRPGILQEWPRFQAFGCQNYSIYLHWKL